jgi:Flp pilus assembly pilin Flp
MQHLATWVAVNLQTTYTRLRERQEGQTMAEYALILGLVAIAVILAVIFLRDEIKNLFSRTGSSLQNSPS